MVGRTPTRARLSAEANRFLLRTERMLAETTESGMNRLSPVRCRQKERRIPRGVSIFSKM
jgi:hypothetical protein